MTNSIKITLIAIVALFVSSCAAIKEADVMAHHVDLTVISIGMTKAEVQTALKKKPDNIIAAERDPATNALNEIVQYSQWDNDGDVTKPLRRVDSYWLYFVNDKLDKWHKVKPDNQQHPDYKPNGSR